MTVSVLSQGRRHLAKSLREVRPRLRRGLLDGDALFASSTIHLASAANGRVDRVDNPGHCSGSLVMLWRPLMMPGVASPVATPAPNPTLRARPRASRSWA